MCLAGAVIASWSLTQEVAGLSSFNVMTNIFVTEFSETFRKNSIVTHCLQSSLVHWKLSTPRMNIVKS